MGQTASQLNSSNIVGNSVSAKSCPVPHDKPSGGLAQCPVAHDAVQTQVKAPAQCPIPHETSLSPAQCPVPHNGPMASPSSLAASVPPAASSSSSWKGTLNPLNYIPTFLSQTPAPSQTQYLPTERTSSSIPRSSNEGTVWEYPSPQQFYNALVRKGWETPEEHVETMVDIHNFLNEQAWEEVLRWEKRRDPNATIELTRFKGRPGELSPKARFYLFAGRLFPQKFNTEPPFDRHDWVIRRPTTGEEVRYVIDYYSAPPLPDGSPVFSLDVRPALDSVGSISERVKAATRETWEEFNRTSSVRGPMNS